MRFWDSSALVPLLIEEAASPSCRRLLRSDSSLCVWVLTRVEIASAIRRKQRERALGREEVGVALHRAELAATRWTEVDQGLPVIEIAERLLGVHPLAGADALQLGAALVLCNGRAKGRGFVTCDRVLALAAEAEGFSVVVPQ